MKSFLRFLGSLTQMNMLFQLFDTLSSMAETEISERCVWYVFAGAGGAHGHGGAVQVRLNSSNCL